MVRTPKNAQIGYCARTEVSGLLMSSSCKINALLEGSELGGVREMQRAQGQLTSNKGPERMGNSPRKTIGVVCCLHSGKMVSIVGYIQRRKMVEYKYLTNSKPFANLLLGSIRDPG